ncbi:DUF7111 family protein [Halorussus pelagicus]|uniref:DUF7111 family protein n=1 Tax=Halorussus pelagicus TaxID=2505977 RepID=UPI001FB7AD7E|nr:hypothetical protein [Halorussus pelagicus]
MTEEESTPDDATPGDDTPAETAETTENGITARYRETADERVLEFESDRATAAVAQNVEGYAMLKVRPSADGDELERYYGFDMALDHAAELLGVSPHDLPVPEDAQDMGM